MRLLRVAGAVAILLLPTQVPSVLDQVPPPPKPVPVAPARVLSGTIGRNATLGGLLGEAISPAGVQSLVETAKPLYDLARLSVGRPFSLSLTSNGMLMAFSYGIDELRTLHIRRQGDALRAEVVTRSYETRVETVRGEISSSLFGAVEDAGEEDQLAVDLAAIFEWDVDFNTELQKGDSFRVAVEKLTLDGQFARYGSIRSAELVRGERLLRAVRFETERGHAYFNPQGLPMRKEFLRSPLKFSRISSRFSRSRLHPVLNLRRAHLGVDYAAPEGTPVRAAADGRVTEAGWSGGFGRMVRIRHGRGMETLYGHLARIAVTAGQRVDQGTVIGTVGSTGLATGPHLDYRTIKNGSFVNPLTIQPPPADPIPASARAAFEATRDRELALLDSASPPPSQRASR
ncbi:MAG TPA: peptidoglycan DD-metalloendopeptidase family protein [Vicinamibacteria bacterium]|nr:peptidoglycan DD-metalloendopeptidase family protein [Vicinamibacteria bacterium]